MDVPQHWVKVEGWSPHLGASGGPLAVWGWSTESDADAERVGRERLAELLARVEREGRLPSTRGYYPRTPLREPVLEEVTSAGGRRLAVVTRNRMGCEVLCTDRLLVADVDVPELAQEAVPVRGGGRSSSGGGFRGLGRMLRRLATGDREAAPRHVSGEDAAGLDAPAAGDSVAAESNTGGGTTPGRPSVAEVLACEPVWDFARRHPDLGVRIYRTAAGLRVLVTGTGTDPRSDEARALLTDLASDPLYVELCATHGSYRARLTPKPFRVGERALAVTWPCADDAAERAWLRWVDRYEEAVQPFATCRLLSSSGPEPDDEERLLVDLHDARCRVRERLPLA